MWKTLQQLLIVAPTVAGCSRGSQRSFDPISRMMICSWISYMICISLCKRWGLHSPLHHRYPGKFLQDLNLVDKIHWHRIPKRNCPKISTSTGWVRYHEFQDCMDYWWVFLMDFTMCNHSGVPSAMDYPSNPPWSKMAGMDIVVYYSLWN